MMPRSWAAAASTRQWLTVSAVALVGFWMGWVEPTWVPRWELGGGPLYWRVMPDGHAWAVATQPGYAARLEPGSLPAGLRVVPLRVPAPDNWRIQLLREPLRLEAGKNYRLRFRVRAEERRSFAISLGRSGDSPDRLLLYRWLEASPAWSEYDLLTLPSEFLPNAKLWLEFGESSTPIEFSEIHLDGEMAHHRSPETAGASTSETATGGSS